MPRYIDADKIAEAIAWLDIYDFVLWHDVMECIDKVPTVDAVEVVRCENCKHFNADGKGWHWCYLGGRGINEDSYCSSGERREDE